MSNLVADALKTVESHRADPCRRCAGTGREPAHATMEHLVGWLVICVACSVFWFVVGLVVAG